MSTSSNKPGKPNKPTRTKPVPHKKPTKPSPAVVLLSSPSVSLNAKVKALLQPVKKKAVKKAAKKAAKKKSPSPSKSAAAKQSSPKPSPPKRPAVIGDSLSCGMLLFQRGPRPLVLVLWRKDGSPDLPKGHTRPGESDTVAALRELQEETGIEPARVRFTRGFVFENTYRTKSKKSAGALGNKTVRVYHAETTGPVVIEPHEHAGYAWIDATDLRAAQHEVHDNPTFAGSLRAWRHHLQRQQG